MDFNDSLQEATFRREAREWLDINAPKELFDELSRAAFGDLELTGCCVVAASKAWQKKKQAAKWACLHWPQQYGGRGASPVERSIWQEEESVYALLSRLFWISVGMCGP